jgi:hypothetical protein
VREGTPKQTAKQFSSKIKEKRKRKISWQSAEIYILMA